jgi:hypothetical protein
VVGEAVLGCEQVGCKDCVGLRHLGGRKGGV